MICFVTFILFITNINQVHKQNIYLLSLLLGCGKNCCTLKIACNRVTDAYRYLFKKSIILSVGSCRRDTTREVIFFLKKLSQRPFTSHRTVDENANLATQRSKNLFIAISVES